MSLLTNLVAFWPLNQSTSGNRPDSTGNGYTLTQHGTVSVRALFPPLLGPDSAGPFTLVNYLSYANPIFNSGTWTVAGWLYMGNTNSKVFWSQGVSGVFPLQFIGFDTNGNGYLNCAVSTAVTGTGTTTLSSRTWYFITLTYDGTNVNLYLNANTSSPEISYTDTASYASENLTTVGIDTSIFYNDGQGFLNGWGIWSRVLTASEISTLYNSGNGIPYPFNPFGNAAVKFAASGSLPPVGSAAVTTYAYDNEYWNGIAFSQYEGNNVYLMNYGGGLMSQYFLSSTAQPGAICQGLEGTLWVTDISSTGSIWKISLATGTLTNYPIGVSLQYICLGPDGNIWGTKSTNTLYQITPNGTVNTFSFSNISIPPYGLNTPTFEGICWGPDNNLWVNGGFTLFVWRVTTSGAITGFPGNTNENAGAICVGPDGKLWTGSAACVQKMTTSGVATIYNYGGSPNVLTIASGLDGNIWLGTLGFDGLFRITTSGSTVAVDTWDDSAIGSIVAGKDGSMWLFDSENQAIYKGTYNLSSYTTIKFPLATGGFITPNSACAVITGNPRPRRGGGAGLSGLSGLSGVTGNLN